MYDKLTAKLNNIDTSGFVLKTKYGTDKLDLEKKIPDISGLVKKKADHNNKITEIEGKIPNVTVLATTTVLTAVGNKMHDVNNFVKKQIMTQKYQTLKLNILLQLIIISY